MVTGAFNCADNGLAGALTDSTGAAGAFASVREPAAPTFAGALLETLFKVFSGAGAGFALPGFSDGFSAVFLTLAFSVGAEAGVGAFAALGRADPAKAVLLAVEGCGVFAGFFIAFAVESTINSNQPETPQVPLGARAATICTLETLTALPRPT